jgi:uncharacterized protein
MRTIALEEHFSTPDLLSLRSEAWQGAPAHLLALNQKLLDLRAGRIAEMDEAGIDVQVLSTAATSLEQIDAATATSLARDTNDFLASEIAANPSRLAGFATVALQAPEESAKELQRCIQRLGFKGAMVNGTVAGRFLDDPQFTVFFEAAQALDVPIYLHPAPPPAPVGKAYFSGLPEPAAFLLSTAAWGWHAETGLHSLRLIVSGLFDRLPRLKIIIGHMGENLPFSLARADSLLSPSAKHLQRRVADYFHDHFHVTTSAYFTLPPFLCALQVVGVDRILFSVDYPYSSNTAARKFLDALPIGPEDRAKISCRNAEALLNL